MTVDSRIYAIASAVQGNLDQLDKEILAYLKKPSANMSAIHAFYNGRYALLTAVYDISKGLQELGSERLG